MNPSSPIVSALVNYTHVLQEAQSPHAAIWQSQFIDQCVEWCLYIETELATLPEWQLVAYQKEAQIQLDKDHQLALPPTTHLLNALHHFCMSLISNKNIPDELYQHLLSMYQLLNGDKTPRENLTKDLSQLARMKSTHNVLDEMEKLLQEELNDDGTGQDG